MESERDLAEARWWVAPQRSPEIRASYQLNRYNIPPANFNGLKF